LDKEYGGQYNFYE
jgi:tubulin polyglutamylase TTLL1